MSEVQRLSGVVVSPANTFSDIDRRPSWVFPFVLLLAVNFAVTFVVYRVVITDSNFQRIARAKILWDASAQGKIESDENTARAVEALRQQRERWYLLPPYAVTVSTLGISIFFYVVLLITKSGTTFRKVFSVVCWSFLIYRVIGGIFTITALLVRGEAKFWPTPAEAWSPTSLAQLVSRTAVSANVYSALSKVDLFLIWWLAVMVIGFSRTSRNLSLVKATIIVLASESAYLVLNAIGALPGAS